MDSARGRKVKHLNGLPSTADGTDCDCRAWHETHDKMVTVSIKTKDEHTETVEVSNVSTIDTCKTASTTLFCVSV